MNDMLFTVLISIFVVGVGALGIVVLPWQKKDWEPGEIPVWLKGVAWLTLAILVLILTFRY
jgi:hypothetical protein